MKRVLSLFFVLSFVFAGSIPCTAADRPPRDSAKAMILYQPDSDTVLISHDEDQPMLIASTTKLMTALLAAESGDVSRTVKIDPACTAVEGSSMYLVAGEEYTVNELLTGLMLSSGNDAALALAIAAAGSERAFVERMNERAGELGLKNTHFDNPHGLDSDGQVSTARDLALLMAAAVKDPAVSAVMGLKTARIHSLNYVNHNKLLWSCQGVCAGKTGYTKAAGRCLVSLCRRDGMELICVTLSDKDDWEDHRALYDWGYANFALYRLNGETASVSVPVIGRTLSKLTAIPERERIICLDKNGTLRTETFSAPFVFAPVGCGECAGEVFLWAGDTLLAREKLAFIKP